MLGLSRELSFEVDRSPEELKAAITQYLSGKRGADAMSYASFEGSVKPQGFRFEEDHSPRFRARLRVLTVDGHIKPAARGAHVSVRLSITGGWVKNFVQWLIIIAVVMACLLFGPPTINVPDDIKLIIIKAGAFIFALFLLWDYLDRLFILWRRAGKINHDLSFLLRNFGRQSVLDRID